MPRGMAKNVSTLRWASEYEYVLDVGQTYRVPFYVYNFGSERVRGTVRVEHASDNNNDNYQVQPAEWAMEVAPMGRVELVSEMMLNKDMAAGTDGACWMILRGDFGAGGHPVLAFRFTARVGEP